MAGADSMKSILYALAANFAIAVAKGVAAVITGSGSMLAEAIHSLADCGNQGLLILGLKRAKRPPTPDYPLGFGKTIYFWSFLVAIMLFSMGGLFSIYEGWHKLHSTEPLNAPYIALAVLGFGIVVEGLSFLGCVREINKEREGRSFFTWFRETRKSELLVIFGEDLAALFGLVFAFIAVFIAMVTGNPMFDALGSISIGVLLVIVAIFIAIEVKALIIGQGVEPRIRAAMEAFLNSRPEVAKVLNLVSLQLGDDVMVAIKAQMKDSADGRTMVKGINDVEAAFKLAFPQVVWLFFEPDTSD